MKMKRIGMLVVAVLLCSLSMTKGNQECKSPWKKVGTKCIQVFYDTVYWNTADNNCKDKGGSLLQISNQTTYDALIRDSTVIKDHYYWISNIGKDNQSIKWYPGGENITMESVRELLKGKKDGIYNTLIRPKNGSLEEWDPRIEYNYPARYMCEMKHARNVNNGQSTKPTQPTTQRETTSLSVTKVSVVTDVPNPTTTAPSETGSAHATNQDNNQQLVLILIVAGAGVVVLAVVVIAVVCFFKCRETKQKTECVTQQDETKPAEQQASSIEDDGRVVSDEGLVYVTVAHAQSKRKPGCSAQPEVKQDGEDDGRVVTEDGLVYVTVAHAQGKKKPGKPTAAQNPREDKVEYAAIGSCTTATIHNP